MTARDWMYLLAASGHLTLAALGLIRSRRSALALPLALLCLDMFGWCFASLADHLSGGDMWGVLDATLTALTPPLALHLVVTFVGSRRVHRRSLVVAYVVFGALAASSSAGFFAAWGREWARSSAWATAFLAAWTPVLLLMIALLVRHLVRASDPDEKARTRTILAAFAIGGALSTADVVGNVGFALPHLAPLGTLLATFLVATAVFRFRLLDCDLSVSAAVYAVALAIAGAFAYLVLFQLLGGHAAALTSATAALTLALGLAVREVAASLATQRGQVERLAALGRFSAQMAHDIKNPLATLKGALQFLQEERRQGRSLDDQYELLPTMLDQVERLGRVVDDYERVGRVQPIRRAVDLNQVIRSVVALERFAASGGVSIGMELADDLPPCEIDADLVSGALENVIRNAFEAMPQGGRLTVRTARADSESGAAVVVSVEDAGQGMDARQAERAFDDFYTTKPHGSGLGLAFVRRVAQAHGGDASLSSRLGVGTLVQMRLSSS